MYTPLPTRLIGVDEQDQQSLKQYKIHRGNVGCTNPYTWNTIWTSFLLLFPGFAYDLGIVPFFIVTFLGYFLFYITHEMYWESCMYTHFQAPSLRGLIESYGGPLSRNLSYFYQVFIILSGILFTWYTLIIFGDLLVVLGLPLSYTMIVLIVGVVLSIVSSIFYSLRGLWHVSLVVFMIHVVLLVFLGVDMSLLDWNTGWNNVWNFTGFSEAVAPLLWVSMFLFIYFY